MQPDSDDDAWRAIVDNYGDRPDLGTDDDATTAGAESDEADSTGPTMGPTMGPMLGPPPAPGPPDWDEEQFVPPPPPPLPVASPDRMVAWTGLFGSPAILLTALVLGFSLPGWFGYLLVTWFIGGFVYLVALMPRGPRDPGDDGARI